MAGISVAFASVVRLLRRDRIGGGDGAAGSKQACASAAAVYGSMLYGLSALVGKLEPKWVVDDTLLWLHKAALTFCATLPARYLPLGRNVALVAIAAAATATPSPFTYPVVPFGGVGHVVELLPADATGYPSLHEAVGLMAVPTHFVRVQKSAFTNRVSVTNPIDVVRAIHMATTFLLAEEFNPRRTVPTFELAGLLAVAQTAPPIPRSSMKKFERDLTSGVLTCYAVGFRGDDKSEGWSRALLNEFQSAISAVERRDHGTAWKEVQLLQSRNRDLDEVSSKLSEAERALLVWKQASRAVVRGTSRTDALRRVLALDAPRRAGLAANDRVHAGNIASDSSEFDVAWATLSLAIRCDAAAVTSKPSPSSPQSSSQSSSLVANAVRLLLKGSAPVVVEAHKLIKEVLGPAILEYRTRSQAFKKSQEDRTAASRDQDWSQALVHLFDSSDFQHGRSRAYSKAPADGPRGALLQLSRPAGADFSAVRTKSVAGTRRLPSFTSIATLRVDSGFVSVFATDSGGNAVHVVGKDGQPSTVVAGSIDGAAGFSSGRRNTSKLRAPQSVCVLSLTGKTDTQKKEPVAAAFKNMLVVSDTGNHCLRFMSVHQHIQHHPGDHLGVDIRVLAGRSALPGSSDGNGTAATFRSPRGIVALTFTPKTDEDTRVFARSNVESLVVCDTDNHVLRVVHYVGGVADDGGRANPGAGSGAFMVHTLAGEAGRPGSEDGPALDGARLTFPTEITCDGESGSLFFVEKGKVPAVRMYSDRTGRVTTITRSNLMKSPAGLCVERSSGATSSSSSSSSSNQRSGGTASTDTMTTANNNEGSSKKQKTMLSKMALIPPQIRGNRKNIPTES